MTPSKPCKDCVAESGGFGPLTRPAPHPGPRCATHHRAITKARKNATAGKLREQRYGLTPEQFDTLWEAQGRVCAICRRPVKVRRPQVDHDHVTGEVRGLTCKPCNRELLGRYSADDLRRALDYLANPPAHILGRIIVPLSPEELKR